MLVDMINVFTEDDDLWPEENSPLQDAALCTGKWRPPGVVMGETDRDTPSGGDYMGGKTVIDQLFPRLA